MKVALITGAGSGIGAALTKSLVDAGIKVYIVGRRLHKLEQTQAYASDKIIPIAADVSTIIGRESIVEEMGDTQLAYLIHNAAVPQPLKTIDQVALEEFRMQMAVNLEAPLFLTQMLLRNLVKGSRILNISSGLAYFPIHSAGTYSISKAGLQMLYQIWNNEFSERGILAGSIQPGVVDTEMQETLRSDQDYTHRHFFEALKKNNQLSTVSEVASKIATMLLEMDDAKFIEKDWDVAELNVC